MADEPRDQPDSEPRNDPAPPDETGNAPETEKTASSSGGGTNWLIVLVAVLVLGFAIWNIARFVGAQNAPRYPATAGQDAFYYNVATGELFGDHKHLTPFQTRDGEEAVRAFVYACTSCQEDRFIAYLQKHTQEALDRMAEMDIGGGMGPPGSPAPEGAPGSEEAREQARSREQALEQGRLVARYVQGQDPQWVEASSEEGQAIQAAAGERCDNPIECKPEG